MKMFDKINRSFSARMSFYVLLFTISIFVITFISFSLFSSRTIRKDANDKATNLLELTKYRIETVFTEVKTAVNSVKWAILDKDYDPDSLFIMTKDLVKNNPSIYGTTMAFEPYFYEDKGYYFSPYSSRTEDGKIATIQLGTDDYDYFSMDWYQIPKLLGKPYWSEPYYDEGGGGILMTTYSTPIYGKRGRFIGILTADISLGWLTDLINDVKPYPSSYCVLLGEGGTYLIHPNKDMIMNETIFTLGYLLDYPELGKLGRRMINRESGMMELNNTSYNDNIKSYIFYDPLESNNWSLAMIIHKKDVFKQLYLNTFTTVMIMFAGLIMLFLFCWLIIKRVTKPLHDFSGIARNIAQGEFDTVLPEITSKDEMRELADSFGFMQKELTNYIAELKDTTSKKERIESELRIASDIQMGMIPKIFPPFPHREDLDLYAILKPAKEVGGDLYDFFIENDSLFFAIGDVSGKGVPASLFMAVTRSLFRSVATHYYDPAQIVVSMNNSISETNEANMFVTMFVGIIDMKTKVMKYCNAGHNPPVIISPEGRLSFIDTKPNIPVGVFENMPFNGFEMTLESGTNIFMYTDGVTEAENWDHDQFSELRMLEELDRMKGQDPRELINNMLSSVVKHADGNEQSDDITMLTIYLK